MPQGMLNSTALVPTFLQEEEFTCFRRSGTTACLCVDAQTANCGAYDRAILSLGIVADA